jgi:murein DD-endopeptidase MepM/ murein hydrolase activator NlpD
MVALLGGGCSRALAASSGPDAGSLSSPPREIAPRDAGTEAAPSAYTGPRSPPLRDAHLRSPMPGGYLGGWYGDTGIDIAGNRLDVFAIAAGTLDYSEWGHTLWTRGRDTPFSVRLALDEPIAWGAHRITHVYYTHLSKVETEQAEGATRRKHVEAGERIGVSGIGNGVPHLHLGLLLDDQVEQDSWTFILREGEIRKVMGNYKNGELLPLLR